MGAESRQPCPECGLFHPYKTCGGSARPKLGVVAGGWSRDEVLAAMRKAFEAGRACEANCGLPPVEHVIGTQYPPDDELESYLEDLVP